MHQFQMPERLYLKIIKKVANIIQLLILSGTTSARFPAGSVSGAPKSSTLRLISKAEGEKRGFYTGVFGYFDGTVLDSAVLIRFIEKKSEGSMFYHSGGGITVNSVCKDEYEELITKIYLPLKK